MRSTPELIALPWNGRILVQKPRSGNRFRIGELRQGQLVFEAAPEAIGYVGEVNERAESVAKLWNAKL